MTKQLSISKQISSFVAKSVKHESEFMTLIKNCVLHDSKNDISNGSAVQELITELYSAGLTTYSRRVKTMAVTKFHFFSETEKEGAGYDKVPTQKEIDAVFNKFTSVEAWSLDNTKKNIAKNKKTAEKAKETNKAKNLIIDALEELRSQLNTTEAKKLDKVLALINDHPTIFR